MKPASLFLLHLILLACFNWFGSLSSALDNYESSVDDNSRHLVFSDEYSRNNNVILSNSLQDHLDFIAPSKQGNRYRIIRKPIFCINPQLNLLHLFFQFNSSALDQQSGVAAARLPAFPLRI
ncbi:MAG: hypothetical protein GX267_09110 [Fibrobacter sp.]|jgi:hypothetical protein|nr:hypothetical protein [Fibrobacter sp.]